MLSHPKVGADLALTVDASDLAIGGVLEQKENSKWKPLAFFSRLLQPPEIKYSTFDRELLSVYSAVRHFRFFLEGRNFKIYTDHKPLTHAIKKVSDSWLPRQQRQLSYISEYSTDIEHIRGKHNNVADALSRNCIGFLQQEINQNEIAQLQKEDEEIEQLFKENTGMKLKMVSLAGGTEVLICDISTGNPRPVLPRQVRKQIFEILHNLSHPGVRTTRKIIKEKYVWKGLNKDVSNWAKHCLACQKAKIQRHLKAPLEKFEVPARKFDHINIDLVGPLPPSRGNSYLLTIVDRNTG